MSKEGDENISSFSSSLTEPIEFTSESSSIYATDKVGASNTEEYSIAFSSESSFAFAEPKTVHNPLEEEWFRTPNSTNSMLSSVSTISDQPKPPADLDLPTSINAPTNVDDSYVEDFPEFHGVTQSLKTIRLASDFKKFHSEPSHEWALGTTTSSDSFHDDAASAQTKSSHNTDSPTSINKSTNIDNPSVKKFFMAGDSTNLIKEKKTESIPSSKGVTKKKERKNVQFQDTLKKKFPSSNSSDIKLNDPPDLEIENFEEQSTPENQTTNIIKSSTIKTAPSSKVITNTTKTPDNDKFVPKADFWTNSTSSDNDIKSPQSLDSTFNTPSPIVTTANQIEPETIGSPLDTTNRELTLSMDLLEKIDNLVVDNKDQKQPKRFMRSVDKIDEINEAKKQSWKNENADNDRLKKIDNLFVEAEETANIALYKLKVSDGTNEDDPEKLFDSIIIDAKDIYTELNNVDEFLPMYGAANDNLPDIIIADHNLDSDYTVGTYRVLYPVLALKGYNTNEMGTFYDYNATVNIISIEHNQQRPHIIYGCTAKNELLPIYNSKEKLTWMIKLKSDWKRHICYFASKFQFFYIFCCYPCALADLSLVIDTPFILGEGLRRWYICLLLYFLVPSGPLLSVFILFTANHQISQRLRREEPDGSCMNIVLYLLLGWVKLAEIVNELEWENENEYLQVKDLVTRINDDTLFVDFLIDSKDLPIPSDAEDDEYGAHL